MEHVDSVGLELVLHAHASSIGCGHVSAASSGPSPVFLGSFLLIFSLFLAPYLTFGNTLSVQIYRKNLYLYEYLTFSLNQHSIFIIFKIFLAINLINITFVLDTKLEQYFNVLDITDSIKSSDVVNS